MLDSTAFSSPVKQKDSAGIEIRLFYCQPLQRPLEVPVLQAVDDGVQHGGDSGVHH